MGVIQPKKNEKVAKKAHLTHWEYPPILEGEYSNTVYKLCLNMKSSIIMDSLKYGKISVIKYFEGGS